MDIMRYGGSPFGHSDALHPVERDELLGVFTCGLFPKEPRRTRVVDGVPT